MMIRRALAAPRSSPATGGPSARPQWRRPTAAISASTAAAELPPPREESDAAAAPTRRALLARAAAAAAAIAAAAAPPPASAGLFSGRPPAAAAAVPAAGGWTLSPPPAKWTLAYDRTADAAAGGRGGGSGPKVMWADFSTLGTIVVSRATREEARWPAGLARADGGASEAPPSDDADDALARADAFLAEARDSPATFGWRVLASGTRALPTSSSSSFLPAARAYEVEFVHQICRGEVLEAAGGARRCANPRDDSELQVVSRRFLLSASVDPADAGVVWVVRGSCPSEAWAEAGPAIAEAVRSFSFAGRGSAAAAVGAT